MNNKIIKRVIKLLTRRGYLIEEQDMAYLAETDTRLRRSYNDILEFTTATLLSKGTLGDDPTIGQLTELPAYIPCPTLAMLKDNSMAH